MGIGIGLPVSYFRQPGKSYLRLVQGTNPLAYWPLREISGVDVFDMSGNGYNGTYSGPTLANAPAPGGGLAPYFDGANDKATLTSAGLQAALNHSEFTMMAWAKVESAAVWAEAVNRVVFYLNVDNNNRAYSVKPTVANKFQFIQNGNSGTTKLHEWTLTSTAWMHLVHTVSVSGNAINTYVDNVKFSPTATGITAYVGSPAIVAGSTGSGAWWKGWLSDLVIWNRALSEPEIAKLYHGGV